MPKKTPPSRANSAKSAPVQSDSGEIPSAEAAKRLCVTQQALGMWTNRPGAPVRRDGTRVWVRWPEFMRWREQELVRVAVAVPAKRVPFFKCGKELRVRINK